MRAVSVLPLLALRSAGARADDVKSREAKTALYGGQAIIEGVMMKGPERTVAACRAPSGKIVHITLREGTEENKKNIWYKTPFLRGLLILVDSISIGYKALMYSSQVFDPDAAPRNPVVEYITMAVSLALALAFFKFIPVLAARYIIGTPPGEIESGGNNLLGLSVAWSAVEGVVKVVVLVSYMLLIRLLREIRRVFMYHGAEHKTINAYEGGSDLSIDDVATYPTFHPRCGTSFLFAVILFSLIFAMLFPVLTLWIFGDPTLAMVPLYRFIMHIIFLPVISSLGYEFIRFTATLSSRGIFMKVLTYPGRMFQKITALEPDRDMLEVSIYSLRLSMGLEPDTDLQTSEKPEAVQAAESTWLSNF